MIKMPVLLLSSCDGVEKIVQGLEKHLIKDSGYWTQPGEVSAKILEWRRRRFG